MKRMFLWEFTNIMAVPHFHNNQDVYSLSQNARNANTSAPGHWQDLQLSVRHGLTDPPVSSGSHKTGPTLGFRLRINTWAMWITWVRYEVDHGPWAHVLASTSSLQAWGDEPFSQVQRDQPFWMFPPSTAKSQGRVHSQQRMGSWEGLTQSCRHPR